MTTALEEYAAMMSGPWDPGMTPEKYTTMYCRAYAGDHPKLLEHAKELVAHECDLPRMLSTMEIVKQYMVPGES